jgi:magnesium chelatase family protein
VNFCKIHSAQATLLHAERVDIEVDISPGLHSFTIVGLPDKAVEESKDRVASALKNSGFVSPKQKNHKITVSLAPADVRKTGPAFDVAIALGYLISTRQLRCEISDTLFVGELSLDGKLQKVTGVVSIVLFAVRHGFKHIFMPEDNKTEAGLIQGITIYCAKNLTDIIKHLDGTSLLTPLIPTNIPAFKKISSHTIDWEHIVGQDQAKRGLMIAAAGGHNIALYGPPGTGKTMLAKSLVSILPPLTYDKIIESSAIHSHLVTLAPFRSPHHTTSHTAIIGGGPHIQPGEITLAHNGVLFLDEFPEFNRKVIESLREPLEQKYISISRASDKIKFPSNFILIVTMNPCPCGYFETGIKPCTCTPHAIHRYRRKISGPIVDRIDMWIEVPHIGFTHAHTTSVTTADFIGNTVTRARDIQSQRYGSDLLNKDVPPQKIKETLRIERSAEELLRASAHTLQLSMRSYHNIIKLARTIADLDPAQPDTIRKEHILEAIRYRPKFN